ncbi:YihY family inner membrane protein [Reinekea marinisedimentorum]|uniref:YihY family inner membrane protein n=2 Tax=Reinekea marinisedimentorum TaxID=230495 RepID=A0A4R3I8N8_9GAMM|nr:YihY family inner membrane protein [Reinekea marinisedimentorum]
MPMVNLIGQRASVLTLTTLFALVPIVSGVGLLLSQVPSFQVQISGMLDELLSYLIPNQAIVWRSYIATWSVEAENLKAISALMFFSSILFLVNRIDSSLYVVFQVEKHRGTLRWLHYLWVMPVLVGALTLLMTVIVLLQIALGTGLLKLLPGIHFTSIPIMWLLLVAVYQLASRGTVSIRVNMTVSILVTAAFYLLKVMFAWLYTSLPNWSLVYGMFSAIPLFLLWCQTAWSLLLYGALLLRWWSSARS